MRKNVLVQTIQSYQMTTVVQGGTADLKESILGEGTMRSSQSANKASTNRRSTRKIIGQQRRDPAATQNTENPQQANATMEGSKSLLTKKKTKPAYLQSLNESEKAENFKIIDNMNKKISYLKNPRHKVSKAPILMTSTVKDLKEAAEASGNTSFRVEPTMVQFADYKVNGVYEIDVKCTNRSLVSKRIKFIPPATENFTVRNVKYANSTTGDLAPGMSLTMSVCFQAPSFADYDDQLVFVTEEDKFKVPLKARRDPPVIKLVNPMDCMNSWLGDKVDMAFRILNEGGDGGFKFFCEKDEDDARQKEQFVIKLNSFTLAPSEFYLNAGQAIDIIVAFQPTEEGELVENLILACDNQTSQFRKLRGCGAMLDLDIIEVDGKPVNLKENAMDTMFFENTNPTSEATRSIKIKNSSPIRVHYHWSIYKTKNSNKIILEDEETHFKVHPSQGTIEGGGDIEFQVSFIPEHAEPYFEFGDLIVEDIPINAVREPPEGLISFAQQNTVQKSKVPMPAYVGSSTQFLSIPIIQFNLRGQGNSCKVDVEPPIAFFDGDTFIGKTYTENIKLKKLSDGDINWTLRMEGKNKESFNCDIFVNGKSLMGSQNQILSGKIDHADSVTLQVQINSHEIGPAISYFFIEIEDGAPISFSCQADFRGPILALSEPVIDVGLAKVNTKKHFSINLENKSPIPASFIIKSSKNKKLNFANALAEDTPEGADVQSSLILGRPVRSGKGNQISFDCSSKTLEAGQKITINVKVDCQIQETLEEHFEIMVNDSASEYFQLLAEVQKPQVFLNRQTINLGKIYAGVKESVYEEHGKNRHQALKLQNFGNLPAKFRWEEINDPKRFIVKFEPSRGVIPPKGEVSISMEIIFYKGGEIDELILCDIEDLELPLGFEIKADAFGLNVAYLTDEEQAEQSALDTFENKASDHYKQIYGAMNKLQMFDFTSVKINKQATNKFMLKNLSGINSQFKLESIFFEPPGHVAPQQKTEIQLALEAEELRKKEAKAEEEAAANQMGGGKKNSVSKQVGFAASVKGSSMGGTTQGDKRRNQPILSDEHEQTQKFTSATGNTFTQTKLLEKDKAFFLQNNKGIAIVFSPFEGDLPANSEIPITVTIYNNVCGKFDDKVKCCVEGLRPIEFPVRINISGSPIVVPANQVGLNYNTRFPTLPMPTTVARSQPISKTFKIRNTGIRSLQVDWSIYDKKDLDAGTNDPFKLQIAKNGSFDKGKYPFKFEFEANEPAESHNSCFKITPKNVAVASRSIEEFTVTFDPSAGVGLFESVILATPMLSSEEIEASDISPENIPKRGTLGNISLNMKAITISPQLHLDKSKKLDGEKHINMKIWSSSGKDYPDAPSSIQKLTFSNDSKADMTFNFDMNGPFEIVKTKSNTGAKHPMEPNLPPSKVVKAKPCLRFCLQPLKIVELHVKFNHPKPADTTEWPMIMKNERKGEITASFANGDSQRFIVHGQLLRPKIVLLTEKPSKNAKAHDELDFGVCNVDKFRQIQVYLSNVTEATAKWQLNYVRFKKKNIASDYTRTAWEKEHLQKVDDPEVFIFETQSGLIKGKSLPLRNMPEGLCVPPVPKNEEERKYLPIPIKVAFRPKQNVLYKCKFRFTVDNGLSCDIILKGKGSFEEDHD